MRIFFVFFIFLHFLMATEARLAPTAGKVLFGLNTDAHKEALGHFAARTGLDPCHWVIFSRYPFRPEDRVFLDEMGREASQLGSGLVLTLEPDGGLNSVDDAAIDDLVLRIQDWERRNIPVFIRYGHEMNGSWYAWSQQPEAYVRSFRRMAAAVHGATRAAMIWAPNDGGGYPFNGGPPFARASFRARLGDGTFSPAGSGVSLATFTSMDTNGDGYISEYDDMYAPFYPGDDAVDWLGMTIYHWGLAYPWGENEISEPRQFLDRLTGNYFGANGDQRMVQDFYADYAVDHDKPLMITETGAFFNADLAGGATELAIKRNWWGQVFNREILDGYPRIRAVTWFNQQKLEVEAKIPDPAGGLVDWTISEPGIREGFIAHLLAVNASGTPNVIRREGLDQLPGQLLGIDHRVLPKRIGTGGVIRLNVPVVLDPGVSGPLVLHADLLSVSGVWRGGTLVPLPIGATGALTIPVDISIASRLPDGETVIWSVFLGDPGTDWTLARAWSRPASAVVDPAVTVDPTTLSVGEAINTAELPEKIPLQGRCRVPLATWASVERDLVVDLLIGTADWRGGGRIRVPVGRWAGEVIVEIPAALADKTTLTWSVLLVPPGGDWQTATARGTAMPVVADGATPGEAISSPGETDDSGGRCGLGGGVAAALLLFLAGWFTVNKYTPIH